MTASRGERRRRGLGRRLRQATSLLPLAVLAVLAAPAAAQQADPEAGSGTPKPLRLEPPRQLKAPATRSEQQPDAPQAPGFQPTQTEESTSIIGGGIQVDQLGAVDPGSVGLLTPSRGGVAVDIWRGTDLASVMELVAGLPVTAESPAMREAMRRLLLSRAATPAGDGDPMDLVRLRVRTLLAMGEAEATIELAEAVPQADRGIAFERAAAEASLIVGDHADACRSASRGVEEGVDIAFWDTLLVFCRALAKETGKVELGLTMLRETGDAGPGYVTLINAVLAEAPTEVSGIETPTPLHVAAAAAAGSRLDDAVVERAGMPVLVALTLADGVVSPEARVEAAERAVAAGAVDGERLRAAYRGLTFDDAARSDALSRAVSLAGPRARALLYQAASAETVPSARAEILGMAVDIARQTGHPDAMAIAVAPLFRQLPVSSDFLWLAPKAVRTLLRVGDERTAMAWFGMIRKAAPSDQQAAQALARLAPLVEVGSERSPLGPATALGAWWDVHQDEEGTRAEAALLGGVLGALGHDIPAGFWTAVGAPDAALLGGGAADVDAVAQLRLQATLAARRVPAGTATTMVSRAAQVTRVEGPSRRGEIAVLALQLLGAPGPAGRPVAVGQQAVTALQAAGLAADARHLALELLLSRGL